MNPRTLDVLEFARIRGLLAQEASFGPGRDAALALEPSNDPAEVARGQKATSEARHLLDTGQGIPMGGLRDIRPLLAKATAGDLLEPAELLDIAQTCEGAGRLRRFLAARSDRCPTLADQVAAIGSFPELVEAINRCINDRAEVADSASRKLGEIRSGFRVTLSRVREKLEAIIRSADYRKVLQDPVITLRQDRYVVPVRAEYKDSLPGVVHDRSASGVTLFVEPLSVVPLNNELRELALQERDEISRILRELTDAVLGVGRGLRATVEALGRIDLCVAKGRLSGRQNAVEPLLIGPGDKVQLDFRQARHPLLRVPPPGKIVPIDVRLGRDFETVVITGPNTGGKTVTLKTVGLLTLMAMSGLHIPAGEGSALSVFRGVWADIGDEQSIEQNLSTFSSHLRNIITIIGNLGGPPKGDRGGEGHLVLLDEIGAGTDPAEGAALAMALLDHFHATGARTIATTHYSEIKAFVYEREGMTNASVEFDVETLAPTYRLMIGLPGKSNALEISHRLGLPEVIIGRAKSFIRAEPKHDVPALIQRLEEDRARIRQELEAARDASRQAREMQEEQARKWANLRSSEEKVLERAREEARAIIRTARQESAGVIGRLRETEARLAAIEAREAPPAEEPGPAAAATESAPLLPLDSRRRLDRLEQTARDILTGAENRAHALSGTELDDEGVVTEAAAPGEGRPEAGAPRGRKSGRAVTGVPPEAGQVRPGLTFYVSGLRHFGEIIEAPDEGGMVGLMVGAMRLTVHVSDLRIPGQGGIPQPPGPRKTALSALAAAFEDAAEAASPAGRTGAGRGVGPSLAATSGLGAAAALGKALTVSPEIMLRGLTVEEALARLEKYLDDALIAGLERVRVIHGKGTGALRQAVAEYLDDHPDVRGHYLAEQSEGGIGATIAVLGPRRGSSGETGGAPPGGGAESDPTRL